MPTLETAPQTQAQIAAARRKRLLIGIGISAATIGGSFLAVKTGLVEPQYASTLVHSILEALFGGL